MCKKMCKKNRQHRIAPSSRRNVTIHFESGSSFSTCVLACILDRLVLLPASLVTLLELFHARNRSPYVPGGYDGRTRSAHLDNAVLTAASIYRTSANHDLIRCRSRELFAPIFNQVCKIAT